MTYPRHWLLRFEGSFRTSTLPASAVERWSVGIRCVVGEPPIDEDDILETYGDEWMGLLVQHAYIGPLVYGEVVKLNEIGPDGKYVEDTTHYWEVTNGADQHGSSSTSVEPQRTLAVSWTTGATRGLAHRGRIYLPGYATPVSTSMTVTNAGSVAADMKLLLDSIQETELVPAVVSGVRAGSARVITGIEVGDRVDTQRRRRRSLTETYTDSPA